MNDDDSRDYGTCCICERPLAAPINLVMLPFKGLADQSCGWGCVVCHLPCEGATAFVCDPCVVAYGDDPRTALDARIKFIVCDPDSTGRAPIDQINIFEPHEHRLDLHAEDGVDLT